MLVRTCAGHGLVLKARGGGGGPSGFGGKWWKPSNAGFSWLLDAGLGLRLPGAREGVKHIRRHFPCALHCTRKVSALVLYSFPGSWKQQTEASIQDEP